MPWTRRLTPPIALQDGRRLRTLGDVRAMIRTLPNTHQQDEQWRYATELLMAAAEGQRGVFLRAIEQVSRVLKANGLI
jgi:hypothetical protein